MSEFLPVIFIKKYTNNTQGKVKTVVLIPYFKLPDKKELVIINMDARIIIIRLAKFALSFTEDTANLFFLRNLT